MDNYIVGRNAVKEALKSGRSIQRILVSEDKVKTGLADIVNLAKSQGIDTSKSYLFICLTGVGLTSMP